MTDILVIGGGIAGVSAAARLAPHAQVTLLEAEEALGYHASGRSAALFEEHYGAEAVRALNRASYAYLADGGYLSPRGFLVISREQDVERFEADLVTLHCTEISLAEAHQMVQILTPDIRRAAFEPGAQDIDTDRLIQNFARQVRTHGGTIETRCRVDLIDKAPDGWTVRAGDRSFKAARIVNAAGAWVDHVAGLAGIRPVGFQPLRRSMARIPAPAGHDVTGWPMFFGPGESWYAKPDAGKLIVSPADEDPAEPHDAWPEDMVLAEGIDRYEQYVTEPVTRIETSWAGLRTFAPDRQLVLGPDPTDPTFIWCAGQGGYGFATSPAASQLLADLVLGRTPELDAAQVAALSPQRFR